MSETKKRIYAAYGSNIDEAQMKRSCPSAQLLGVSSLSGYRLLFKSRGDVNAPAYLTIEKCPRSTVPLAVWEIDSSEEPSLDEYEDYPELYYKESVTLGVKSLSGKDLGEMTAFVYIMYERFNKGSPTAEYFSLCCRGFEKLGFDIEPLIDALNMSF